VRRTEIWSDCGTVSVVIAGTRLRDQKALPESGISARGEVFLQHTLNL
jgi:hypothetical protein